MLALFAAVGGFSAATGMVIVSVLALSIMISNNLVLPLLLQPRLLKRNDVTDLSPRLLGIRRVSIVIVLLVTYSYFKSVGAQYALVSIGLISFTAAAQFGPLVIGAKRSAALRLCGFAALRAKDESRRTRGGGRGAELGMGLGGVGGVVCLAQRRKGSKERKEESCFASFAPFASFA